MESVSGINVYNVYSNEGGPFRLEGMLLGGNDAGPASAVGATAAAYNTSRGGGWAEIQVARRDPPRPAPPSLAPPPALLRRRVAGVPGLEGRGGAGGWAGRARAGGLVRWRRGRPAAAVWRDAEAPARRSPAALSARAARRGHGGGLPAPPPLGGRGRGAGAAAASGRLGPAAEGRARERHETAGGRGRGRPPRARHRQAAAGGRGRVDLHELIHRAGPDPHLGLRCDPCARAARPSLPRFTPTLPSVAGGPGPLKSHSVGSPQKESVQVGTQHRGKLHPGP